MVAPVGRDPDDWTTVTVSFIIRKKTSIEAPATHTNRIADGDTLGGRGEAQAETGGHVPRNTRPEEGHSAL
jgi:hypothetical protein